MDNVETDIGVFFNVQSNYLVKESRVNVRLNLEP